MSQLEITLPDGSSRSYEKGTTGYDIARSIAPGLAKAAIAVKVNGLVRDLYTEIPDNAPVSILTFDDPEGRTVFWHSSSHIMAQAVVELFPTAKPTIGPPIAEGWYYDFEVEKPFSPEDLEQIEKRMAEIVKENAEFKCERMTVREAVSKYKDVKNEYKVEILENDIEGEEVTFYRQSRFEDLCRGPHIPRTGIVKAFKLIATSGAYWRGDEHKTMLQRIYGVSYPKKAMLEDYLLRMEEAKKRDHRVIGKQQELFTLNEEVGPGLVLWLPRGARIRNEIENFWREEHLANGYELVFSPHVANLELWNKSGHTGFYAENMFKPMDLDDRDYQLKPMNCPFHIMMFKSRIWSYRDLPQRWAELGTVYRYERAGVLHGLMRVRGFTQDDAHHFVSHEQMEDELVWLLDFCTNMLGAFGFKDYDIMLSTRPEKSIGDPADWEKAENGLRAALDKAGLKSEVDEGGGAFYGPKIDIKIKDAIGRSWQCSTIQFDFSLPERFDLNYVDRDGQQKRPFMIHRALLGSIERFFGVLIEHYSGNFPVWLAPEQVKVLPITDAINEYAASVVQQMKQAGLRAQLDDRSEKIGAKIRDAELLKVPYMFIVGAKEAESGNVSVRRHGVGDLGVKPLPDAVAMIKEEIASKGAVETTNTTI